MRIAILNDETTETYMGGAALVNDTIMSQLKEQGHEVNYIIKNFKNQNAPYDRFASEYDFYILANIAYFNNDFLNNIFDNKRFITFRHDIPTVLYMQPPSMFHKSFLELWQKMFEKAEMSYFISPMQERVFKSIFDVKNSTLVVPPLGVQSFKNEAKMDRNGCLYVGDISMARGCVKTLQIMNAQHPKARKLFVGKIVDKDLANHLKTQGAMILDAVPHERIAELMNEYEYLYYTPEIYDSFCLKIMEAELCGMNIIADIPRIGYFSWNMKAEELVEEMNKFHIAL